VSSAVKISLHALHPRDPQASIVDPLEARPVGAVEPYDEDGTMPHEELIARAADKDAVVCMLTDRIDRAVIDAAGRLKVAANVAVGYNNVDVAYAKSRAIVTNTPDVLTESVADFTWALILALTRRLSEGERLVRRGGWKGWAFDFMLGTELRGKQIGIVGFGRIGQAVAARAPAFGMRVAYAGRRDAGVAGAEHMSIDRLLNSSDVVSLHVPLTGDTRHLIDKRSIARMKRSAYLINTARGPVVDEEALAWALQQHLLAGAALDVYENEPAIHPDLLRLENVLLVPHLAAEPRKPGLPWRRSPSITSWPSWSGRPPLTPVG
jgi:glyoxylate reductase